MTEPRARALRVLCGLPVDRVPVAPLLGACSARLAGLDPCECYRDPVLQTAAQAASVQAFRPDIVFPFMDLTAEPEALGARTRWREGLGPEPGERLEPGALFEALQTLPVLGARLELFAEVVGHLARAADGDLAVGAYVSGPWTLVSSCLGLAPAARLMRKDPELAAELAQAAARFASDQAAALAGAGARIVMVLEPCVAGGILSPHDFSTAVADGIRGIAGAVRGAGAVPVLHVCGDANTILPELARFEGLALSLDAPVSLSRAASLVAPATALMGNVSPVEVLLRGTPQDVARACRECLEAMPAGAPFILSTGCEVPPDTPADQLRAMCGTVVQSR